MANQTSTSTESSDEQSADNLEQDKDSLEDQVTVIDESLAERLVFRLRDEGVVEILADEQVVVHHPSGRKFESNVALAYFHEGWTAATSDD